MARQGRFARWVSAPLVSAAACAFGISACGADADSQDAGAGMVGAPSAGGTTSGSSGTNASSGGSTATGGGSTATGGGSAAQPTELDRFSFFVTSLTALQRLSGNPSGFGGDLRYGEADGLSGADKICTEIAESSMPGSGAKGWRAFLSAVRGPDGAPVHAIDRIGEGPWYDRIGRLVAMDRQGLLGFRPAADPAIVDDLPNEDGIPNHDPDGTGAVDNHDTLTGTNAEGQVYSMDPSVTCEDWTTKEPVGRPRVGHAWPRFAGGTGSPPGFPGGGGDGGFPMGFPMGFPGGDGGVDSSCFFNDGTTTGGGGLGSYGHWMSSLSEAGCAAVIYLKDDFNMDCATRGVGAGGGYGGFYCFALQP
jgi:hypothetical protein